MAHLNPLVSNKDHIQGNSTARIELVEYGDYQCPHCGRAYPIIKSLQRSLGADLKFIFRNFPLSEIHPDAFKAAAAAETAALQQKFWEMHDIIFEHQEQLDVKSLVVYAKTIGLDLQQFRNDFAEKSVTGKVEQDFESGIRSGVNGTPSFFINGEKYNGDWELDEFEQYLRSQLAAV